MKKLMSLVTILALAMSLSIPFTSSAETLTSLGNIDRDALTARGWEISTIDGYLAVGRTDNSWGAERIYDNVGDVSNFTLEMKVRNNGANTWNGAKINFRNYYSFALLTNTAEFGKIGYLQTTSGTWLTDIWNPVGLTRPVSNTWYDIKIVADGSNIKIYYNNILALDFNDSTYSSGKFAIESWDWAGGAIAKFAEMKLTIPVDKTSLYSLISTAQAKHDAADEGTLPGQYTADSKATFQTAINNATIVYNKADATAEEVNAAKLALTFAIANFDQAVIGSGEDTLGGINRADAAVRGWAVSTIDGYTAIGREDNLWGAERIFESKGDVRNFTLEMKVRNNGANTWNGAKINFRNYYSFALLTNTAEGQRIGYLQTTSGTWLVDIWNPEGLSRPVSNTWYDIKIVANGNNIKIYYNNTLALDFNDSTYATGKFSIESWDWGGGAIAKFAEMKLTVPTSVTYSNYNILNNNSLGKIITNIEPNISVGDFMNGGVSLNTGVSLKFKKGDSELLSTDKIATGTKIEVYIDNYKVSETYITVIYGDVNGDSDITIVDLTSIKSHLLKNEILSNEYFLAGDLFKKGTVTISDLIAIKKHLLNITAIGQS